MNMRVIRFNVSHLRNEEWFRFYTEFKTLTESTGASTLEIDALFTPFLTYYSRADRLLEVLRKNAYTKQIEDADKERDRIFSGLYGTVKLARNQPDAAKRQAAESLIILLEHYKNLLLRGGYSEESGAIYNLLQDLSGNYAACVSLLGLSEWAAALHEAEDHFLALYGERHSENADKPKAELAKVRSYADRYYVNMMNQLDIVLLASGYGDEDDLIIGEDEDETPSGMEDETPAASPAGPVPTFVIAWNEQVKKYRNLLALRKGRRSKKEAEMVE
jgi:hypothetical protein